MKEQSTSIESASRICYETMEAHARGSIQTWLFELALHGLLGEARRSRRHRWRAQGSMAIRVRSMEAHRFLSTEAGVLSRQGKPLESFYISIDKTSARE